MPTTSDKRHVTMARASRKLLPLVSSVTRLGLPTEKQLLLSLDALFEMAEQIPSFSLLVSYKAWIVSGQRDRDVKGL